MSSITRLPLPASQPGPLRWPNALTPLSRGSRRRWTLAYAALLCLVAVYFGSASSDPSAAWLVLFALLLVFGMLRRGTRRLAALDHQTLDERDRVARDRAFRVAYPLMSLVLVAVAVILFAALPSATRQLAGDSSTSGYFLSGNVVLGLGLWVALWAVFLPTGILAWTEPDTLTEPGPSRLRKVPESARDALLLLTLLLSYGLGAATHSQLYALVPAATVTAVLALVGRGAPGRVPAPMARPIRVALVLAAIVTFAALGYYGLVATDEHNADVSAGFIMLKPLDASRAETPEVRLGGYLPQPGGRDERAALATVRSYAAKLAFSDFPGVCSLLRDAARRSFKCSTGPALPASYASLVVPSFLGTHEAADGETVDVIAPPAGRRQPAQMYRLRRTPQGRWRISSAYAGHVDP